MSGLDYHALFLDAPDGMVVVGANQRVIAVNTAFAALVGEPPEAIIGRNSSELVNADGSRIPLETLTRTTSDGTMLGIVRGVRHRPFDEALREAEARLRAMSESLNVALVITNADNCTLYANEHLTRLTGYLADEIVGRDLGDFLATDFDRASMTAHMHARRGGVADKYEVENRRKDGSTFTMQISASPMFDDAGHVIGTIGVMEDVTERRRQERDLAERERRYRSLFEVTPLPTWVFDIESLAFCTVNPAAVQHYGYTEDEFLSMTLLDIRTPEEARSFALSMQEEERPRVPRRVEHRKKDGSRIQVDVVAEDFVLDGRKARIVVAHDVTEELRLEQLQRNVDRQLLLAQKMEAVGGLAGGVAHDFNNLLSVMLGASESIASELAPDSPLHDDVRDIREAAERGGALTRQLLSLGRREVRVPDLLDLNVVLASMGRLLHRALGPTVRIDIQKGEGPLSVVADAGQIEQVIVNLAINARDAMPEGGIISVATTKRDVGPTEAVEAGVEPGRFVTLEVRDEGIGMDAETRVRAFEPFFTTKGPHQGTGLGLSTVYGIARESGGGIRLESAKGAGTCVTLYLPLSERTPRVSPAPGIVRDTGEHAIHARRGLVLLVEDDARVRSQARRLLERSGFAVIDAPDGAEGLFQFRARAGAVDVVISDVMMPTMGGVEMVAQLRQLAPTVPVVFVSGYSADDRELPLDVRTRFVAKPYSIESLCAAIDMLLAR